MKIGSPPKNRMESRHQVCACASNWRELLERGEEVLFPVRMSARLSVNPNGIVSFSPGLRGTSYPGRMAKTGVNPNGVVAILWLVGTQPRWGW